MIYVILVLGLMLRLVGLDQSLWLDEAISVKAVRDFGVGGIINEFARGDFHPPLYYLLVHGFMQIFGESEWIRLLSTVFFILTLIPVYYLAKKLINKTAAWVSTVLVAFSPILFIYAFEARSYALLTLISVLTTLFFWQAVSLNPKNKKPKAKNIKFWIVYALVEFAISR